MAGEVIPLENDEFYLDETTLKKYVAPNATEQEFWMFMNIARSFRLNPYKREIHFIKYNNQAASIVVGYEAYLKRAERTGKLDGWDVRIEGAPGNEKAVITIYRKDRSKPFVWEVYRKEVDRGQAAWKIMPLFMLRKVAIAQGMRLCFPEDLGGMPYIPEEIVDTTSESLQPLQTKPEDTPIQLLKEHFNAEEVENFQSETPATETTELKLEPKPVTEKQRKKLFVLMREAGLNKEQMKAFYDWAMQGQHTAERASLFIDQFDNFLADWQQGEEDPVPF